MCSRWFITLVMKKIKKTMGRALPEFRLPVRWSRQAPRALGRQSGFTLIEIVVAFSILVMVFGLSYSALSGIISSKQLLDDGREAQVLADAVLSRMTRELQLADPQTVLLPEKGDLNNRYESNVNLVGVSGNIGNNAPADSIAFMARGAGQHILGNQVFSGEVKLTYRLEEDPEQDRSQVRTYVLVREETPNIRPLEKAFERTMIFPVCDRVVGLSLRYYDSENDEWHTEWGKAEQLGLPALVEITLGIRSNDGNLFTYSTAVPVISRRE